MPTIIIFGPARAFAGDPRSDEPIADLKTLARFHGLASEQACAELFDEPPLSTLGLSGGRLRFEVDEKKPALRIVTAYRAPRELSREETELLVEATRTQWSDGCGSGSFQNFCAGPVLSTALAMALPNSGEPKEHIGEYFVDAFPFFDHEEARVEFLEANVEKTDLEYVREAAAWGDPEAQFQLAQQLKDGDGIEQNERLAFENYQKAAVQGHWRAFTLVGICFQEGIGTAPDLKRAFDYFTKAAETGTPLAMHCLGDCYIEGKGVAANPAEGIEWYRRGVAIDDVGCTAELGECYELGKHVPKDLRKALELYERCMENGFDAVEPALARVKGQLKDPSDKKRG